MPKYCFCECLIIKALLSTDHVNDLRESQFQSHCAQSHAFFRQLSDRRAEVAIIREQKVVEETLRLLIGADKANF